MSVADDIRYILSHRGIVTVGARGHSPTPAVGSHSESITGTKCAYYFERFQLRVHRERNQIERIRVPGDWKLTDAIDVGYVGAQASFGYLRDIPGYIWSAEFSGCKFYLWRRGIFLHAVHAARDKNDLPGAESVLIKPRPAIEGSGGRIIWTYDSRNRVSGTDIKEGSAVLCVVGHDDVTCFAFTYRENYRLGGIEVDQLIEDDTINNWRSA